MSSQVDSDVLLTACGAALPAPGVVDRMTRHLQREAEVGGYAAEDESADELAEARSRVGPLLGLEPGNVSLTDSGMSATVSLAQAMLTGELDLRGRMIVTDPREFGANLVVLRRLADASGARVELLEVSSAGRLDVERLGELVASGRVGLVWLSLAHAHAGWTNPVGDLAPAVGGRSERTWLVLDVCQSFGQLPDDLAPLEPDAVIGTSRKWVRGPRGVGFGWLHPDRPARLGAWPELSAPPLGVLERHEGGIAAKVGLGVALAHLEAVGAGPTHRAVAERARLLRSELGSLPGWRCIDDPDARSAIVSLAPTGPIEAHADTVAAAAASLADRRIRVTSAHRHHAPGGMESLGAGTALRLGAHADQPFEELQRAVEVIAEVVG